MSNVIKYRCSLQGSPDGAKFRCMHPDKNLSRPRDTHTYCTGVESCMVREVDGESYLSPTEAIEELSCIQDRLAEAYLMNDKERATLNDDLDLLKKRIVHSGQLDAQEKEERRQRIQTRVKSFETLNPDEKADELMSIFNGGS